MFQINNFNFELIAQSRIFYCGTLSLTHPHSRLATVKALDYAKEAIRMVLGYADIVRILDYVTNFLYGYKS